MTIIVQLGPGNTQSFRRPGHPVQATTNLLRDSHPLSRVELTFSSSTKTNYIADLLPNIPTDIVSMGTQKTCLVAAPLSDGIARHILDALAVLLIHQVLKRGAIVYLRDGLPHLFPHGQEHTVAIEGTFVFGITHHTANGP